MGNLEGQQFGNYILDKFLGHGGFADVYRGKHIYHEGYAAIKVLHTTLMEQEIEAFRDEAKKLVALKSRYIVPILDYGVREDGIPFLVMEYASDGNVRGCYPKGKPLSSSIIIKYVRAISEALDFIHNKGKIHRDVKPENILLDSDHIWLSDFGIAVDLSTHTLTSSGTRPYMAPEQFVGRPRFASDQYALGIVVYEWLCGERPFKGESELELKEQHQNVSPPSLRGRIPTLSQDVIASVETVVFIALAKKPEDRFASVAAFARALEQAFQELPLPPASQDQAFQPPLPPIPMPVLAPAIPEPPPISAPVPDLVNPAPSRERGRINNKVLVMLALLLLLYGMASTTGFILYLHSHTTPGTILCEGCGVTRESDGEYIGISAGGNAFDTTYWSQGGPRPGGSNMQQAGQDVTNNNLSGAATLWIQAVEADSSNAEAWIYLEDQKVFNSGLPYVDIVVATMLTGVHSAITVGRNDLQGAYVAQKTYNYGYRLHNGVQVRLLIANSGCQEPYSDCRNSFAIQVAQQIAQLAKVDSHFVGVMGWPYSTPTQDVLQTLQMAHIPMVSETAVSESLTGASPYFFRVAPSDLYEGQADAHYVEASPLNATRVALFVDKSDLYSQTLASAFSDQFTKDGKFIAAIEPYKVGKPDNFPQLLKDAESHQPDLIYFAGYAADADPLLRDLPTSGPFSNLQVMGGNALDELGAYTSLSKAAGVRLHYTAFAHPDEWGEWCSLRLSFACHQPNFFNDYKAAFDPNNKYNNGIYGYARPSNDAIMSYDATLTILSAVQDELTGSKTSLIPADLLNGLEQIHGMQAVQGVSGQISFDSKGNPTDKALVIVKIVPPGFHQIDSAKGCFQVNQVSPPCLPDNIPSS